ncbi:MAG: DUF362 domain-containing protein [Candidatus Hydrothermarchaeales archaeon]
MPRVAMVKGGDRRSNLRRALKLLEKDIDSSIDRKNSSKLFIKINAIDINFPLACTDPAALDVILEHFRDRFEDIIVGDNSFAFSRMGDDNIYTPLAEKFDDLKFSDLTDFGSKEIDFKRLNGSVKRGRISTLPESAYTISLALPKTHDHAIFTACLKNMMGCVVHQRPSVHSINFVDRLFLNKFVKSIRLMNENLVRVIGDALPDLCILDGFVGMEGDGPIFGSEVQLDLAMCSLDGVALDTIASKIAGFETVHYLKMCEELELGTRALDKIEILKEGFEDLREVSRGFTPHYLYNYQLMLDVPESPIPKFDFKLFWSYVKRFYRIKDKAMERIRREGFY